MNPSWMKHPWMIAAAAVAACATAGLAMSVSPARTEIRLPPGGKTTSVITITNPHPEAYDVEISEKPWFIYPENREIPVEKWLLLPFRKHFRLKAGQSRAVKISVRCPPEAKGELMGMVSFAYQGSQGRMVTPVISTAIYLDVKGTEKNAGEILELAAGTKNGRFQVGVQLKATGNVRLRPAGRIRLLHEDGTAVADYALSETVPLFPMTIRDYEAMGPDKPPSPGHYRLVAEITSGMLRLSAERGLTVRSNGDIALDSPPSAGKEAAQP